METSKKIKKKKKSGKSSKQLSGTTSRAIGVAILDAEILVSAGTAVCCDVLTLAVK